jgi:hypothetical protein
LERVGVAKKLPPLPASVFEPGLIPVEEFKAELELRRMGVTTNGKWLVGENKGQRVPATDFLLLKQGQHPLLLEHQKQIKSASEVIGAAGTANGGIAARPYKELRQAMFDAQLAGDENSYYEAVGEIANRFKKDERKMLPELLRMLREKYSQRTYTTGEIDIRNVESLRYALDGYLPEGEVVHLFAPWFKGKTCLALGMAAALIRGEGFLDTEIANKPRRVLFIQTDAGASRFKSELEKQMLDTDPRFFPGPEQMLHVWAPDDAQGREAWTASFPGLVKLRQECQRLEIGAIFIDSVKGMMSGTGMDYTHNETVNQLVTMLRQTVAMPLQAPVVLLNHKGTDQKEGAGAKAWSEACGQVIEILGVEKERQEMTNVRELVIRKDSISGPRRFHYTLDEGRLRTVLATDVIKDGSDLLLMTVKTWSDRGHKTFRRADLLKADGGLMDAMSRASIDRALDRLSARGGPLRKIGQGKYELREG